MVRANNETMLRVVMPLARKLADRRRAAGQPVDAQALAWQALQQVGRLIRIDEPDRLATLLAPRLEQQLRARRD